MDALARLQNKLHNFNQSALSGLRPGDTVALRDEQFELEKWLNGDGQLSTMTRDAMLAALQAFRQDHGSLELHQLRMVCYGCTQALDDDALIETRVGFSQLLAEVVAYTDRPRAFRKLYRGLLCSYFSYDPEADDRRQEGRDNWFVLRAFLLDHLESLPFGEYLPVWQRTLNEHANLLCEDPCQPYAMFALQGEWAVFGELRERLDIGADSWLVRQMVMSPILAATRQDDVKFKGCIHWLLSLLNEYSLYAFAGLKILLDRYAECAERECDESLKHFAIEYWGNPWLPADAHQWLCSEQARKMVAHWHMRFLLDEFFSVLSSDGRLYPRRWEFWDVYSADMTGLYFALGQDVYASENSALSNFLRNARGLIVKLAEENAHACIMQFEHYHVVELNRTNSTAYFYDTWKGEPSFYTSQGWVETGAVSVSQLMGWEMKGNAPLSLRHQDGDEMTWEGTFADELGVTANAIKAFCQKYQCKYVERHSQDKYRWIRPEKPYLYGSEVWSVLAGWGFEGDERGYYSRIES